MKQIDLQDYAGKELYIVGFNTEDRKLGNHFKLVEVAALSGVVFLKVEEEKRTYIGERLDFSIPMEGSEEEIVNAREAFKEKKKRLYEDEKNWQINKFVYFLNLAKAVKIILPNL